MGSVEAATRWQHRIWQQSLAWQQPSGAKFIVYRPLEWHHPGRMWQRNRNPPAKCSGPRMVRSPSGWINSTWESMNVNAVGTLPLWHCFGMPQVYPTTCPWESLNQEKRCGVKWLQKESVPQPCGSCFLILYSSIKNCCTLFFSTALPLPMKTKMMRLMHSHATIHCSTPHCFGFCFFQQKSTLQKPCSIMSVA